MSVCIQSTVVNYLGRARVGFDIFSCFLVVCSLYLFRKKKNLAVLKLVRCIVSGVSPNFTSCISNILVGFAYQGRIRTTG
jgi:hypothetical protein